MDYLEIYHQIVEKESFLCIGLDSDIKKIPKHLLSFKDPVFEFNRRIIDATAKYCVCYKPNVAFYEENLAEGWESFVKTVRYIKVNYPDVFIIADAKRGDIGNTSSMYARAFLEKLLVDAITVAPYMGEDSVRPFLEYEGKWVALLALTSNKGALDFQMTEDADGEKLYEKVIRISSQWADKEKLMYVVGATQANMLEGIRKLIPDNFLLVPGVGAQGGSLEEVARYGMNEHCGLLVNSSRGIIYADNGMDFAVVAAQKSFEMQQEMKNLLIAGGAI